MNETWEEYVERNTPPGFVWPDWTGEPTKTRIVEQQEWPVWAKLFRLRAIPEDVGVGDTVARMIGKENSEAFKHWFKLTFGKDCGCTGRQHAWNIQYPYDKLDKDKASV